MRIPCAKCGHIHDSTVTPFLHDNIKLDEPNPNPAVFYNMSTGSFKCINCSAENRVKISWTATEGDKKKTLRKEESANVPEDTDRVL